MVEIIAAGCANTLTVSLGRQSTKKGTMRTTKRIVISTALAGAIAVTVFTDSATQPAYAEATAQGAIAQGATPAITEAEAHAIGVEAYIYFYPLVTMDLTRKQSTNVEPGKEFGKGPMNMFVSVPEYPPADLKVVVRVNFDTLYSIAWLDLTKEALVVSAPDTDRRFYLLPMLDMWTDVFASPGWRTTGTAAGNFLVTPPGWTGTVPEGFSHIAAPTPYVWIIGRTKTDGPQDHERRTLQSEAMCVE